MSGWLDGRSPPSLETAAEIQDLTGVPAVQWVRFAHEEKSEKSA